MKKIQLVVFLLFSAYFAHAQQVNAVDDTLSIQYSNSIDSLNFEPLPYYDLNGFQQYRPFGRSRLPIARSGNIGLVSHSLSAKKQDWNINYLLGGYQPYLMTKDSLRYYKMSRPITLFTYYNGAEEEQFFNLFHSQNFGEGLNLSFEYQRTVSKGFFLQQLSSHTQFNTTYNFSSRNKRFNSRGYFLINNLESQENGGIVLSENDDPDDNTALLSINLRNTQNQSRTQSVGSVNQYHLIQSDTSNSLLSLAHELEWSKSYRNYKDDTTGSIDFYSSFFIDNAKSADSSYAEKLSNTLELQFFNNQISVGFRNEQYHYFQNYLLNQDFESNYIRAEVVGEVFNLKTRTAFEKGLSGFHKEELDLSTEIQFQEWKGIQNELRVSISQKQADYFLSNQRTNHEFFSKDLNTSNQSLIEITTSYEKRRVSLIVGIQRFENFIYFDSLQRPQQFQEGISNIYVQLNKQFTFFKHWQFLNKLKFQQISEEDIIPLPQLFSYHSFYYENRFFKSTLKLQAGFDFYYIGKYGGYAYTPSLAQFYVPANRDELGGINQLDVFVNLQINKSARIFLKMENILSNSFSEDSYRIHDAPIPGRALKVGFSWRMVN